MINYMIDFVVGKTVIGFIITLSVNIDSLSGSVKKDNSSRLDSSNVSKHLKTAGASLQLHHVKAFGSICPNIRVTDLWRSVVPRGVTLVRRGSRALRLIGGGTFGGWSWYLGERRAALTAAESGWSAMPRFTVHIRDEWLAVPCRDTANTIRWLGQEALKRYIKNKPDNGGITAVKDARFVVRRCQSLGLLDADDTIDDVLEDNDFVELGMTVCMQT